MHSFANRTGVVAVKRLAVYLAALLWVGLCCNMAAGQAEVSGWGNLRGIRVGGQLVPFTSAVGVYNPDFSQLTLSQREGPIRTSQYIRNGNAVTVGENLQYGGGGARGAGRGGRAGGGVAAATGVTTSTGAAGVRGVARGAGGRGGFGGRGGAAGGFNYTITYTDSAPGTCEVNLRLTSAVAQTIGGVYYFLTLPGGDYENGTAELIGGPTTAATLLAAANERGQYLGATCTGIRLTGKSGAQVEARFPQALKVIVQHARSRGNAGGGTADIQVYFPIVIGNTTAGQTAEAHFTIKAAGEVDARPVTVTIEPAKPGRKFTGMGGNYRIQSPRDAQIIQYVMDNMRVAYGRVAMPWNTWQPEENAPPPLVASAAATQPATLAVGQPATGATAPARGGRGGFGGVGMNSVAPALEIAQKLAQQKIPMILSCWFPPSWAVLQNTDGAGGGGGRGQRLDTAKWDAICKSIGSYLMHLRDRYGAEPEYFSFNESNIGINVKQTPEDHAEAIKKLGAYFKSIGLKTKMLLGDTGDALPVEFIQAALNDPEAVQYIGAVSFHSWRGATDAQYQKWTDAALKLGVPLFDAEGGNDAQASSYRNIFREAWYALDEAAEYVRIMRICQPESILEWQLTDDYSVLAADAAGALQPTQRFYNLKQFNLAPSGSAWIPARSSNGLVLPAACVDPAGGGLTVHLVNNGASRPVTVAGLPSSVTQLSVYVTDEKRGMAKQEPVKVSNGSAQFTLQGQALTTLVNAAK